MVRRGLVAVGSAAVLVAVWSGQASATPVATHSTLTFSEWFGTGAEALGVNASGEAWGDGSVLSGFAPDCGKYGCIPGFAASSRGVLWNGTTPTDVTPSGASASAVLGLGDDGTAIGAAAFSSGESYFVRHGGATTVLPAGQTTLAVNSKGVVLVAYTGADGTWDLGTWTNGVLTEVVAAAPNPWNGQVFFNAAGTIVIDDSTTVWEFSGGSKAALPEPAGFGYLPEVVGLDDHGRVLAYSDAPPPSYGSEGVVWTGGVSGGRWSGTSTLLQPPAGGRYAEPKAINAAGTVVGSTGVQAVRWSASGGAGTFLPVPAGDTVSDATGISDAGTIIGYATTNTIPSLKAQTIWVNGTTPIPAFSSTGTVGTLTRINATGKIVGWGNPEVLPTDTNHAYSWTISGS